MTPHYQYCPSNTTIIFHYNTCLSIIVLVCRYQTRPTPQYYTYSPIIRFLPYWRFCPPLSNLSSISILIPNFPFWSTYFKFPFLSTTTIIIPPLPLQSTHYALPLEFPNYLLVSYCHSIHHYQSNSPLTLIPHYHSYLHYHSILSLTFQLPPYHPLFTHYLSCPLLSSIVLHCPPRLTVTIILHCVSNPHILAFTIHIISIVHQYFYHSSVTCVFVLVLTPSRLLLL